jgi:hypothetical protein
VKFHQSPRCISKSLGQTSLLRTIHVARPTDSLVRANQPFSFP